MHVALLHRRLLAACLIAVIGSVGAVWFTGSLLIAPHREMIGPPPEASFESITFHNASGANIHGWYAAGCPGHGAVLLLHGVRANRLAMLPRAQWLQGLGYGVLLIDFQASGESDGRWITLGAREANDAVAATNYLRRRAPGERIAVIGTSMGGAAALLADPPLPVDAMVLEQVYPDITHAVSDRLQLHLGGGAWLTPWMLRWFTWQTGVTADQLRPIDRIARVSTPKLIIVGSADEHTPLRESMAMYAAAATPKSRWIVQGARHVDLYQFDTRGYQQTVAPFLSRWLGNAPADMHAAPVCGTGSQG